MSFRSKTTLEAWVEEFRALGHPGASTIRVMSQDGTDGSDTGLVGFRLPGSPTEIYIEPLDHDGPTWAVTFEPREEPVTVEASLVRVMATEMNTLAALCEFLQRKSG